MVTIVTLRKYVIPARRIAGELEHLGFNARVTTDREVDAQGGVVIRYGAPYTRIRNAARIIQPAAAIRRAADKLRAIEILHQSGVPAPEITEEPPCIGRRSRQHFGGKGVFICLSNYDVEQARNEGAEYFVRLLPVDREYRQHIITLGGEARLIAEQVKIPGERLPWNTTRRYVRNHKNGWWFVTPRRPTGTDVGLRAVEVLGLDFGAVDLVRTTDGRYAVLEVNTAPGVEGERARLWAEALARKIEEEE